MDDLANLFWMCVDVGDPNDCWEWKGPRSPSGYGRCPKDLAGENGLTHRTAYAYEHGKVPDGMWVLHHCDNRPCCNPAHLFAGTAKDNVDDMDRKGRRVNAPRFGEENNMAKLDEAAVREIRCRRALGERAADLAEEFQVTRQNVRFICNRATWKHVD